MKALRTFIADLQNEYQLIKMGFVKDQNGIIRRYMREKQHWDDHLIRSKNFILKSAERKEKGTCVVLGSGWLLDLPLNELANMFSEVLLIDLIHPQAVMHKIQKLSNVKCVHADITGGLVDLFYKSLPKNRLLPESLKTYHYELPVRRDFVISLNILCQLHILLLDYAMRFNVYSQNELAQMERIIQESHLEILPKNKTCLITDFEEEILDEKGKIIGINPLIHVDLPEGNFSQQWQWKFDSGMTYREEAKTFFNTKTIDF
jgi:hypothetical protein